MAEEEFQESEVIFSDDNEDEIFHVSSNKHGRRFTKSDSNNNNINNSTNYKKKKMVNNSVPVNIPVDAVFRYPDDEDDDLIGGAGELVPPHLVVGRRLAGGNMAYSVRTGTGRTLKGRDLSQVRNSILRLTGFLET